MNGVKVVLPIWHKVSKDEVLSYSPSLADKVALNSSLSSVEEIAEKPGRKETNSRMKVYDPKDMNSAFAEAFNSGNIEDLVALYEPGAVLVPRPGQVVEGTQAIRSSLEELLAIKGRMRSENQYALVHGDIALLRAKVHLVGTGADGNRIEIHNHTSEVVRRQPDGSWLYILDHPYGADPLDAPAV